MHGNNGGRPKVWDEFCAQLRSDMTDLIQPETGFLRSAEDLECFLDHFSRIIAMIYRRVEDVKQGVIVETSIKRKHYLETGVRLLATIIPHLKQLGSNAPTPGETWVLHVKLHANDGSIIRNIIVHLPAEHSAFFPRHEWERMIVIPMTAVRASKDIPGTGAGDPSMCQVCKAVGKMLVCSKCRREYYCSVECQRKDWKHHKRICTSPTKTVPTDNMGLEYRDRNGRVLERLGPALPDVLLRSFERNCFGNCAMNIDTLQLIAGVELDVVAGSLGLCDPAPTWYEWGGTGGKVYTTEERFNTCRVTGLPSVHFWLADSDGKVWDIMDHYLIHTVMPAHKKKVDMSGFALGRVITGESVGTLKARGLLYVPAPPDIQRNLIMKSFSSVQLKKY